MGAARRSGDGPRSERSRLWKRASGRAGRGAASQQSSRVGRRTEAASMAAWSPRSRPARPPPPGSRGEALIGGARPAPAGASPQAPAPPFEARGPRSRRGENAAPRRPPRSPGPRAISSGPAAACDRVSMAMRCPVGRAGARGRGGGAKPPRSPSAAPASDPAAGPLGLLRVCVFFWGEEWKLLFIFLSFYFLLITAHIQYYLL